MAEFFGVRMQFYDRRKKHLTEKLSEEWEKLDNKVCVDTESRVA